MEIMKFYGSNIANGVVQEDVFAKMRNAAGSERSSQGSGGDGVRLPTSEDMAAGGKVSIRGFDRLAGPLDDADISREVPSALPATSGTAASAKARIRSATFRELPSRDILSCALFPCF
jgi:hypothetical protein